MKRVAIILFLLCAFPALSYGQSGAGLGGRINLGGKPTAAIILGAPSCDVLTNVNSISVNSNPVGANRFSLAIAQFNGTGASAVSLDTEAQSFALIGTAQDENLVKASVWGLVAPTLGTQTVTAQLSEIVGAVSLCVLNFENVFQSTPTSGFVETGAGSNSVNLSTSSAVGDLVIAVFVSANNAINTADDTLINAATPGSIIVTRIASKPGAPTVAITYGLAGTNAWDAALVNVVKAP